MFDWVKKFDLILLDFDGLLVNTEFLHYTSYKKMVESLGFSFPIDYDTYCSGAHISTEELKKLVYSRCLGLEAAYSDWMKIREIKQRIYIEELKSGNLSLLPGVKELIESIDFFKKRACIVTNSPLDQILLIEEKLPILKSIPYRITRENYTNPKPAADSYKKAIESYGKLGDRVIGFEDTPKGVQALIAADVTAVEVNQSSGYSKAHFHFEDFFKVNFA